MKYIKDCSGRILVASRAESLLEKVDTASPSPTRAPEALRASSYKRRIELARLSALASQRPYHHKESYPVEPALVVSRATQQHQLGPVLPFHQLAPALDHADTQGARQESFSPECPKGYPFSYLTSFAKILAIVIGLFIGTDLTYIFLFGNPSRIIEIPKGIYQGFNCGWDSRVADVWTCDK